MDNIQRRIVNVTGGYGGDSFLIIGDKKTALIDCGLAYCASNLLKNIKKFIQNRNLDYLIFSHSHYDHVGALPYIRKVWPDVKVFAAKHAIEILSKPKALHTIKDLANQAGIYYGAKEFIDYDDTLMKVNYTICDNDSLDLGGVKVLVIETPGHTKCSLSFIVNSEVIFSSETAGCITESGEINCSFICSYKDAIKSIEKCQNQNAKYIISPHFGWVNKNESLNYWEKCIQAANKTRDFVLKMNLNGYNEEQIFKSYKNAFQNNANKLTQPDMAFEINNTAMIKELVNNK